MSKTEKQENLFLSERELTLTITFNQKDYSFDFDAKEIMEENNVMPIDILKDMSNINIRVKDFKPEEDE